MQFILESPTEKITINENVFIVGRAPSHNLVIKHPSISKDHAMIEIRENKIFLKDLEALNGTRINGVKLEKNQQIELSNNDVVEFGKTNVQHVVRFGKVQKAVVKQNDRKINLKDYFEPIPENKNATAVEKRINMTNMNLPSGRDVHLQIHSEVGGIKSGVTKNQLKSTKKIMDGRIKFNNLNDFLKDQEIEEDRRVLETQERQHRQQERPSINRIAPPQRVSAPPERLTPPPQRVTSSQTPPPTPPSSTKIQQLQLQRLKKAQELQAVASQYQAMYRQKLLKTKSNLKALQKQQSQVIASIETFKIQKQQAQQKLKIHQAKRYQAQQALLAISTKNQIMIEYAEHLQTKQSPPPTNTPSNAALKQINDIRKLLKIKCKEINKIQEQNNKFLNNYTQHHSQHSHMVRQLKQNIQQIISIKSQLYQYIQRQKQVQFQWQNQLKKNNDITQSIKSLLIQIRRNSDNMKHTQNQNARKLCDYHIQFMRLMKGSSIEKRKASEYLVEKMQEIQKQKITIIEDCQNVHLRIEETLHEIQNVQRELKALTQLIYNRFDTDKETLPQHELMYGKIEYLTKEAERYDLIGNVEAITRMRMDLEKYQLRIEEQLNLHESIVKNIGKRGDVSMTMQPVWQYFSAKFVQKDLKILELRKQQDRLMDVISEEKAQIRELELVHDRAKRKYEGFKESKIKEAMDAIKEGKRCL